MPGKVDINQPLCDQLPYDRAPGVIVMLAANSESRNPVVAKAADALIVDAKKDIDTLGVPAPLPGSVNAGQYFLRGYCPIEEGWWFSAGIAIAAWFASITEIRKQHLSATVRRFGQPEENVEFLPLHPLALIGRVGFLDEAAAQDDIVITVEQAPLP